MLTRLPRYLARALALSTAFAALLMLASPASALGPPTILAVGQVQHHVTASWALPAGSVSRGVEISDSPSVASDGAFFSDHVKSADSITELQTAYTSTGVLDPGTYYIHVAAYVPNCDLCPNSEWSAPVTIIIPPAIQPVVEGSGVLTGPGGMSCTGATCPLTDAAAGPVALTAAPGAGFLVLSWDVEGIDAADTCGVAMKTCTVTVAAAKVARVTVKFAPVLPTLVKGGLKAYACSHRVEVLNPRVEPRIDTEHPYLGTLTIVLKTPYGKTITRKYKTITGYYSSPDFYKLKPAKTYVATVTYSGDEWRAAKSFTKSVKLGRC
jgi:hypothetical protein